MTMKKKENFALFVGLEERVQLLLWAITGHILLWDTTTKSSGQDKQSDVSSKLHLICYCLALVCWVGNTYILKKEGFFLFMTVMIWDLKKFSRFPYFFFLIATIPFSFDCHLRLTLNYFCCFTNLVQWIRSSISSNHGRLAVTCV